MTVYIGGNTINTTATMRPRDPHDHYQTEPTLVEAYFQKHPLALGKEQSLLLDVGAGSGVWGSVLADPYTFIDGVELQSTFPHHPAYTRWITDDFLTWEGPRNSYDAVVGNPPFKHADDMIMRSREFLKQEGETSIVFLLRIGFLASQVRYHTMYTAGLIPSMVTILNTRPSFTGDSKTYPGDFAIFRWDFIDGVCTETGKLSFFIYERN